MSSSSNEIHFKESDVKKPTGAETVQLQNNLVKKGMCCLTGPIWMPQSMRDKLWQEHLQKFGR